MQLPTRLASTATLSPVFRALQRVARRHLRCYPPLAVTIRRALIALSLLLAAIALGVAAGPSCAAPTLPIPPPTALVEGPPDAEGLVLVTGNARPGAFVSCLNQRTEEGVVGRADVDSGEYALRIRAAIGDDLTIWQFESTGGGGEPVHRTVPER